VPDGRVAVHFRCIGAQPHYPTRSSDRRFLIRPTAMLTGKSDHPGVMSGRLPRVSSTAIWVPISSAVAALFGAGFGAMLQGRYGVSGWRRQIRLEAYTGLLNAAHDYDSILYELLKTIDEANFDEKWQRLDESFSRLARAATPVSIAGPRSVDAVLTSALHSARAISFDMTDHDSFISIVRTWRETRSYDKWQTWVQSAEQLTPTVRAFLKTG
jgi:hypothetical protein